MQHSTIAKQPDASALSGAQTARNLLSLALGNRLVLATAGIGVTGAGLALGWDWLSAIGVAPLIVATAPCLIMCALGMCMMGKGNRQSVPPAGASDAQSDPPPKGP